MGSGEELQGSMQDRLSFRPQLLWLSDRLGNRLQNSTRKFTRRIFHAINKDDANRATVRPLHAFVSRLSRRSARRGALAGRRFYAGAGQFVCGP